MAKKTNSIYKIAEAAGVSAATVSKVINGRADVGAETCQKVREIMRQMDFKPSVSRTFMDTIGIFMPLSTGARLSNPYLAGIASGISDAAGDSDFIVSLVNSDKIPRKLQDFVQFCRMRKISGGIFPLLTLQDDYLVSIAEVLPTVTISRDYKLEQAGCVMADNLGGGYEAVKHLTALGHRQITLVNPSSRYPDHNFRIEGAMKAMKEAGLDKDVQILDNSLELGNTDLSYRVDELLSGSKRPSALFVASDQEALRFIRLLGERGISIPDDISIAGFDDLHFAANTNPPLTTIRQPLYEMGREACSKLIQLLERDNKGAGLKVLGTELIVRKSTKRKE